MQDINNLKKKYIAVCNEYVVLFCEKQDLQFHGWIGDEVGTIALCGDYFFNFTDIVLDMNTNQPKWTIVEWYDNTLAGVNVSHKNTSYSHFIFSKNN